MFQPLLLALLAPAAGPQATCPSEPLLEAVGSGTPGAGGIPQLTRFGLPGVGHLLSLGVEGAAPLSPGLWIFSGLEDPQFQPDFGAVLYPAEPLRVLPFVADESGTAGLVDLAPVGSSACGLSFVTQALLLDDQAQGGVAFTEAYRIAFGTPVGTPFAVQLFEAGPSPFDVATADFDVDGVADLLVGHFEGASVLLGQGDGEFETALPLGLTDRASAVAAGDLNGDGFPDALSVNSFTDELSLSLGMGDGSFGLPAFQASGSVPVDLTLGDLNQDGALDVVVANRGDGTVTIHLGIGDGSLEPATALSVESSPSAVALADLDVDGVLDLAVTRELSNGLLRIHPGLGDGGFASAIEVSVGRDPMGLAVGFLNADTRPDLVVTNH